MARVKHIVGWISVVLLVVTLASIWILTEQNVEQTSSLSESTARAVEGQAADVRPDAVQESQRGMPSRARIQRLPPFIPTRLRPFVCGWVPTFVASHIPLSSSS